MNEIIKSTTEPEIQFWYEFGSNYSYLSAMRIENAASKIGAKVSWRPFLLGPIFQTFGWSSSPFVLQKEKGIYTWKDMERQCAKFDLPWQMPSVFPRAATLPMKIAAANADAPWIGRYSRIFMTKNFALDEDINSLEQVTEVLVGLGLDANAIIEESQSEAKKNSLREATAQAQHLSIFGAPTFFVRGEMFWGNDRLDDALAFAVS